MHWRLIPIFLLLCCGLSGQNFNGHWEGLLHKIDETAFRKSLDLVHEGDRVSGTSKSVVVEDTACYIIYALEGEIRDGKLFIEETEVLEEESFNQWYWCTKLTWLDWEYTDSTMVLSGTWKANGPSYYRGKMTIGPCEPTSIRGTVSVSRPLLEPDLSRSAIPDLLERRLLNPIDTIFLNSRSVELTVWDDLEADGDVVSLFLDGRWILRDHLIASEPLSMSLELSDRSYLVLHAESIGNTYPNTAAISFDDGKVSDRVKLRSNYEQSHLIVFAFY